MAPGTFSSSLDSAFDWGSDSTVATRKGAGREPPSCAGPPSWSITLLNDAQAELIYYGQRFYSPGLGRFINRDPIEEQGGINLYAFVRNNSVSAWDYLGMDPLSEWMEENLLPPEAPVFSTPVGGYPMDASIGTSFGSGHDDMEYDPRTASWVPSGSIMRDNVDFMSQAVQAIGDLQRLQARAELSGSIQLLGRNSSGDYVVAAYTPDAAVLLASNSSATVFTGGMSLSGVTSLVGLASAPNS